MSTLVELVRADLGIKSDKKDGDIQTAVRASFQRLRMRGVEIREEGEPLTQQAVKLYCRAWFNFQGDGDRYRQAFEALGDAMALSGDYRECRHE